MPSMGEECYHGAGHPESGEASGETRVGPMEALKAEYTDGGTASLFIWNLVFDPVVAAMRGAVGARAPTYVDDLAALVRGPRQAARAQIFLLAAGHCAGLLTRIGQDSHKARIGSAPD